MNVPFPADALRNAYRKRIESRLVIHFSHWDPKSGHTLWGGFRAALDTLQRSNAPPPMLIFGLHSPEQLEKFPDETKVLKWPGIQYLRYDADDTALAKAVQSCLRGSTEPVPECLFVTVGDITPQISEIRHWLENRLRNTNGALHDFKAAERGEIRLHPNHLEPVDAISSEHQAMLDRFRALESDMLRLVPEAAGLKTFSAAIGNFQSHWQTLETAKKALRNSPSVECSGPAVSQMIEAQKKSRDALETAIAATRELDNELTEVSSETS